MGKGSDETATQICEKAILEIEEPAATAAPEMYRVCDERNHDTAFARFLGTDSGNRLAASRMEPEGASGALKTAIARARIIFGRKAARRRVEPSDML